MDALTTLFNVYNLSELSSTDYEISHALITHVYKISECNINEMSELCHFSAATLSRFCKSVGFDSYASFRRSIKESLAGINLIDYVFMNNFVEGETLTESYLRQIGDLYGNFANSVKDKDIQRMADNIYQCKKVVIFSAILNSVYFYLQIDFALNKQKVISCHSPEELKQAVDQFDKDCYLLVFKHQLKFFHYVDDIVEIAKSKGARIGVVTNTARSPLKSLADDFVSFDGVLHYIDNLLMDTYCMLLSATFRNLYTNKNSQS